MNAHEFPTQHIPQRLTELDQWVCWKLSQTENRFTKVPISPKTGYQASSIDPRDWASFEAAMKRFQGDPVLAGIGFIFTPDDCFTGIDLDRCLDEAGNFTWGKEIVDYLATYTEVSPSGRGVKLIVEGCKPPHVGCQRKGLGPDQSGQIEIYDHARFFTITGRRLSDAHTEIAAKQDELTAVCQYFWPETSQKTSPALDRSNDSPDEIQRRAIAYLDAMPPAISGGGGHSQTYTAATALVHGFGIEPSEALTILTQHYNPRCVPPWSDKELRHKISQAATKPHDRPFGWLRDECTSQPLDEINLSQFNVRVSTEEETDDDPPIEPASSIEDPGPLPERLLRIPGFVNEVVDHCLDTAPYPNPVMAFCGALAMQAFLAGRRVRDPGDNRTNLYLLGLAHSAAGKDWPRKLNVRILQEIGVVDQTGERFASGEGLQDALHLTPAMLYQTDEIDGLLQSISKSKDARYEQIMSTLLTMYSSANSIYPMRRKAGKEAAGVINQPSLVIFGTAIPNHYYEALSDRMLTNGLFARMLIFECGKRGRGQEPKIRDIPGSILETAQWWENFRPGVGNLVDWNPTPAIVQHNDEASGLLVDARVNAEIQYEKAEDSNDSVGTTVWGRVSEQTRKLALLHAISRNHLAPIIDADSARWAIEVVEHQTRRMLFMANDHVSHNDFDAMAKAVVRQLKNWKSRNGIKPMPEWELTRRLPWKPSDHKEVIKLLDTQRLVVRQPSASKTRPGFVYRLVEN
jgi:hypothetical protein